MSSANHRLRQAINIRDNAFNLMRRLSEDSNEEATSQWNQALIEMQQKALEAHWSSFQTHSIKISAVKNASILQTNQTKMVSASELYITVKQQLESLLRKCDPDRYRPKPKVSEIVLEKFNGNFTCWTAWRARFKSAVLDTQLPAGTKIDLLLSALMVKRVNVLVIQNTVMMMKLIVCGPNWSKPMTILIKLLRRISTKFWIFHYASVKINKKCKI